MAYSSGIRQYRVAIFNRVAAEVGRYGRDSAGVKWTKDGEVWASVDYARGKTGMREGSLDVYAVVLVRMLWNDIVNARSIIQYDGQFYRILGDTFHSNHIENTIQFHAQVMVDEPLVVTPTPEPTPEPTPKPTPEDGEDTNAANENENENENENDSNS